MSWLAIMFCVSNDMPELFSSQWRLYGYVKFSLCYVCFTYISLK